MKLVIAEKPSVAQSLSAVIGATARKDGYLEGSGWRVSWCVGHLAGLADADSYDPKYAKWRYDDLPILPEHWQMVVGKDKKKQFDILKKLMNAPDVTEVVNACDAGREGELIFRSVYELAGCQKPMKRLWISSMEDSAIREGFANLRPGADYDGLRDAALCRAKADWLVGINATRLFSVLYHRTLNIGRVMSPTLALIVQREAEIDTFKPVPFYTVALELPGLTVSGERMADKTAAEQLKEACQGGTPLVVSKDHIILGVIYLKDIIKAGVKEKFADLRKMGIRTVMITGDNPLTAAAIAAEAGVDDFLAEATPEGKLDMIRKLQAGGHMVAMTGDGTNDAPALAQADVAVAMNTGTQAAKEAGNMVDLDSSPTKLIDIVRIGKQLLMTRGSLTTFSIANDVAKYFAIIPALFMGLYPGLAALNIMGLHSAQSAIFSAIIYNALIIVALIPLALKGVKYREVSAGKLLSRNLLVYGAGGIIAPFLCIKLIDMMLTACGLFA